MYFLFNCNWSLGMSKIFLRAEVLHFWRLTCKKSHEKWKQEIPQEVDWIARNVYQELKSVTICKSPFFLLFSLSYSSSRSECSPLWFAKTLRKNKHINIHTAFHLWPPNAEETIAETILRTHNPILRCPRWPSSTQRLVRSPTPGVYSILIDFLGAIVIESINLLHSMRSCDFGST